MNKFNLPYLEPYNGRKSRHFCPRCRVSQVFTLYIDGNTGVPINPTVGRCNREVKCGYHYTPAEYFRDNPHLARQKGEELLSGGNGSTNRISITVKKSSSKSKTLKSSVKKQNIDYIPIKYVVDSASFNSNFVRFLCNHFHPDKIEEAFQNYALGATMNKRVIFWQIDINGKVRTGKMIQYDPETGKRSRNIYGGINWVHSILKKRNPSFANFQLSQCYFGEHLLRMYPDKPVAIVEAEKTAVIGSMIFDNFNWLASGNLQGLTLSKSEVLRDRDVVLYPDAGCFDKWSSKMKEIRNAVPCNVGISKIIEEHATNQELEYGYDIADYIIEELNGVEIDTRILNQEGVERSEDCEIMSNGDKSGNDESSEVDESNKSPESDSKANSEILNRMIEKNPALGNLIDELGLEGV